MLVRRRLYAAAAESNDPTRPVAAVTYCDFLVLPVDLLNSVLEKNEKMRALVEEYALRVHRTGVLRPRAEQQHGLTTTGERQSTAGERLARCFCQAASTFLKPRRSPSPPPSCGANSLEA